MLAGNEASDGRSAAVPAMVAEVLGLPALTHAREVTVEGGSVTVRRETDDGVVTLSAELPAVVCVNEKINEPRYPSFKGIMAAKKKPVTTLSLADAGLDAVDGRGGDRAHLGGQRAAQAAEERGREGRRRRRRWREDGGLPGRPEADLTCDGGGDPMGEVLVLVDHVDGEIKKSTFELLTAARALGEPAAVVVGRPGTARSWPTGCASTVRRRSTSPRPTPRTS